MEEFQSPIYLKNGVIGSIKIRTTWLGTVKFEITGLDFELGVDPLTMAKNMLGGGSESDGESEDIEDKE